MRPRFLDLHSVYTGGILLNKNVPVPHTNSYEPPSAADADDAPAGACVTTPPVSRQNSTRPYFWKEPSVRDVYSSKSCASIGGSWEAASRAAGYGWGCVQPQGTGLGKQATDDLLMGNTLFSTDHIPFLMNNIVDIEDCNYCMQSEQCWKPLLFNACHNCSALDMLGLSPSLGIVGGIFRGAMDVLKDIFGGFEKYVFIVIVVIIVCILCGCVGKLPKMGFSGQMADPVTAPSTG